MSINGISSARVDINEMLSKIRDISSKSKTLTGTHEVTSSKSFNEVMSVAKGAVSSVNQLQTESEKIKTAYISGDSNISMSQVVVASQKSKLAFEGLVSVRNKILEAYKEIMNMPV